MNQGADAAGIANAADFNQAPEERVTSSMCERLSFMNVLIFVLTFAAFAMSNPAFSQYDWTAILGSELSGTNRLVVRTGGNCCTDPKTGQILLDLSDITEISQFVGLINITESSLEMSCNCCGNPTFELYHGEELRAALSFHHTERLRWFQGKWPGDGLLSAQSSLSIIEWLANHNVKSPKIEREWINKQKIEREKEEKAWLDAMPSSIKPYWKFDNYQLVMNDSEKIYQALEKEYPQKSQRILALLKWYGSGSGTWNAFPAYESVANEILKGMEDSDIIKAASNAVLSENQLSESQKEGAARFLAPLSDRMKLPKELLNLIFQQYRKTQEKKKTTKP